MHRLRSLLTALGVALALAASTLFASVSVAQAATTTFTVNSNGDQSDATPGDGVCATAAATCTLRAAIQEANADAGVQRIAFNLPNSGVKPYSIVVATSLPDVTDPVVIDGTTQPNGGVPTIVTSLPSSLENGLTIDALVAGNSVRGLDIENFALGYGLAVLSDRNTIAGNDFAGNADGVYLGGNANRLVGNGIGTLDGTTAFGNSADGVVVTGSNNIIGGTLAGNGNVISGNSGVGILIGPGTSNVTGNVVEGNLIGTTANGARALPNAGAGILLESGDPTQPSASSNTIGPGNLISGNTGAGVEIANSMATANTVEGNEIGTDSSGAFALANGGDGVFIVGAPGNTIGGINAAASNVISGNANSGVEIRGAAANSNLIEGNLIGTDATGMTTLGNSNGGVYVDGGAPSNTIGGSAAGAGNVISGNAGDGVTFSDSGTTGNQVLGNKIGTNAAGTAALPNSHGLFVFAGDEVVGAPGAGNLISGNAELGIFVSGSDGINTLIQANRIGTDSAGNSPLPNGRDGILLSASSGNTIGGTSSGDGNLISGNAGDGVNIIDSTTTTLRGNIIGTNVGGSTALANGGDGIVISDSPTNTVGGTAGGAGNLISGNAHDGVHILNTASTGDHVLGNKIGTDQTGSLSVGNGANGVEVAGGASQATIGGATAGAGNVISANADGVTLGTGTTTTVVQGNRIGTDLGGTKALGNTFFGVFLSDAPGNTIGGTTAGARNLISGNGTGVRISGNAASGNFVEGNYIGTNLTGTRKVGNVNEGIFLDNAPNNTFGGTAAGAGNVVSGNGASGIRLLDTGATGNRILGNKIGTNAAGTTALANVSHGVFINNASSNTVGGATANIIDFNGGDGVFVESGTGNLISRNSISANVGLGIGLGAGANDDQSAPVLRAAQSASNGTVISGTLSSGASKKYTIELFSNPACDPSGFGEGKTFLGSTVVTTDASGHAHFTKTVATVVLGGQVVTATAIAKGGDTSQFSACVTAVGASTVYIQDATVNQPKSGTTNATFTVTLSPASAQTVTVNYATAPGTATAGVDYTTESGTVSFAAGQTTATISIPVLAAAATEPNQTFFVNLSGAAHAAIGDAQALGTIVDGGTPPPPALYITNTTVIEGGTVNAVFTVTLSPSSAQTVTVNYATVAGTAAAGTDYTSESGTLTFTAGQTTKTISVPILDDSLAEATETFAVTLSAPANATLGDNSGAGIILNDD